MIGECPRCQARLELPQSGAYQCTQCRARFDVFVTEVGQTGKAAASEAVGQTFQSANVGRLESLPHGIAPEMPVPPELAGGTCAAHPQNAAVDLCERCGDFMCGVCRTVVEGRRYCPRCFELLFSRGSLQFTQRQFTLPGYALALGLLSFPAACCSGLSVPAGIAAVIMGTNALRQIARQPDLPGRSSAIWGIVLGAIASLLTVGLILALIVAAMIGMEKGG